MLNNIVWHPGHHLVDPSMISGHEIRHTRKTFDKQISETVLGNDQLVKVKEEVRVCLEGDKSTHASRRCSPELT
jgi:hypothetical protein